MTRVTNSIIISHQDDDEGMVQDSTRVTTSHQSLSIDRLHVMIQQESTTFRCDDYFHSFLSSNIVQPTEDHFQRGRTCTWLYEVVDTYEASREVVAYAISYFDRFMSSILQEENVSVRASFTQLVALAALRLAIRIYHSSNIPSEHLDQMSTGKFSTQMLDAMEINMLSTLEWHLFPPTAVGFVHELLRVVVPSYEWTNGIGDLFEHARFFTELSVRDYSLCVHPVTPSMVAFASVLNTLEMNHVRAQLPDGFFESFLEEATAISPMLSMDEPLIGNIRLQLLSLYVQSTRSQQVRFVPFPICANPVLASHP